MLSIEQGLSSREVYCSVEDKNGYMWFGTSNGLNRYDGTNFKIFTKENFGLLENEIGELSIDDSNRLFIVYYSVEKRKLGKVEILDLNTYTLHKLDDIFPAIPFKAKDVVHVTKGNNNQLNIITANPYRYWTIDSSQKISLVTEMKQWDKKSANDVEQRLPYFKFSLFEKTFTLLNHKCEDQYYLTTSDTSLVIPSNKQYVYLNEIQLRLLDENLNGINNKQNSTNRFKKIVEIKTKSNDNMHHFVYRVEKPMVMPLGYKEDFFVFFDYKKEISILTGNDIFKLFTTQEFSKLPNFGISSQYMDSRGILWLCTNTGIFQIVYKKNVFTAQFNDIKDKFNIATNQVRGIWADSIVIGNKKHKLVLASIWDKLLVTQDNVLKLFKDTTLFTSIIPHNKSFYVASSSGMIKYNVAQSTISNVIDIRIPDNSFWSIYSSSDSTLLLGGIHQSFAYNEHTKRVVNIQGNSNSIPSLKNVYKFVQTKKYGLVAVAENGLFFLDKNNAVIDYYGESAKEPSHQLPIDEIYDLLEDKNGVCWIASAGQGLYRWDWNAGDGRMVKKIINFRNGVNASSNIFYRIEEDNLQNLWISTYTGLLYFNTKNNFTHTFTIKDGLPSNEFNRTSSFKASDGKIYFGGVNGMISFYPEEVIKGIFPEKYPLVASKITKFVRKDNSLEDITHYFNNNHNVIMNPGDTYISIDYAFLDFEERITEYAYKIEGLSNEWQPTINNNLLLSQLPFGKFTLRIKARQTNGEWNPTELVIPIRVIPPFYLTQWFRILSIVAILGVLYFLFYARNLVLRMEKKKLASLVKLKTNALSIALEEKGLLLSEIHHRVKNNLQTITQLLHMQSDLITPENIHFSFKESEARIKSIALIHEKLYQNHNINHIEINVFVQDIIAEVSNIFKNEHSTIEFENGGPEILLDIKTAVPLGLILNELITNSYKYLPRQKSGNKVCIHWEQVEEKKCSLSYRDNGPGLPDGVDLNSSKGMGLKLVKGLSKQLGGGASYRFDEGSTYIIVFIL